MPGMHACVNACHAHPVPLLLPRTPHTWFVTRFARAAYSSVLRFSSIAASVGAMHAMSVVSVLPPSELFSSAVSLESRYGTCAAAPAPPVAPSAPVAAVGEAAAAALAESASTTCRSVKSDLLMARASSRSVPARG